METWPSLSEAHHQDSRKNPITPTTIKVRMALTKRPDEEEESSWEVVSADNSGDEENTLPPPPSPPRGLHKSISTPTFIHTKLHSSHDSTDDGDESNTLDESSFVLEYPTTTVSSSEGEDETDTAMNDGELVSFPSPMTKRTPSFKDAILLNAAEVRKEEALAEEAAERELNERQRQRRQKPQRRRRIIVSTIKRCSKSAGDLGSLVSIRETGGGGGDVGCGGMNGTTIGEDEVMGETDASDYYHRKNVGRTSRKNGLKLRPDEAKRRDGIVAKKNVQRQAQMAPSTPQGKGVAQKNKVKVSGGKRNGGRKKRDDT